MVAELLDGRYRVDALIGRGGIADVHAATDIVTGERVALKLLRGVELRDRRRFELEARVLAALDHPAVVRLRGAADGDHPFLVLDLVEGPSLADLMAEGPLPAPMLWEIGADIAEALAHAHARSIVHRDVKPGNVLLERGRARLADFGIARLLGAASNQATLTNQVLGTPAYLAPEQVRGRVVTAAADVYAAGLVLAEAASGRRCFEGTAAEVAMARLHQRPALPSGLPLWAGGLLHAMVAMEPEHRPDAAEVARCLREQDVPDVAPTIRLAAAPTRAC